MHPKQNVKKTHPNLTVPFTQTTAQYEQNSESQWLIRAQKSDHNSHSRTRYMPARHAVCSYSPSFSVHGKNDCVCVCVRVFCTQASSRGSLLRLVSECVVADVKLGVYPHKDYSQSCLCTHHAMLAIALSWFPSNPASLVPAVSWQQDLRP